MGNMKEIVAIAASLFLFVGPCAAQPVACPSDANLQGYTSISAINSEMNTELSRIAGGGTPEDSYLYILCPNTDFNAVAEPLIPVLSGASFTCGADGASSNNCKVIGGIEQVRIADSTVATYPLSQVSFSGITFEGFGNTDDATGTSVNGMAASTTTATFQDVLWRVSGYSRKWVP